MKKRAKKKVNKWIQGTAKKEGAVKHPGALTAAAKQHGRSTLEEAKAEEKSPDKRIAARGRLALRFMGRAKHGNIGKTKKKSRTHKRVSSKRA